jgi:hypothetical protein
MVLATAVLSACSGKGSASSGTPAAGSASSTEVIVLRVPVDAVLKEDYRTLDELAASRSVDLVVAGTVVRATPTYQQQVPGTELTVQVTTSNSPTVRPGSRVVVQRDGGRVPLVRVLPDLSPQVRAQLPSAPPHGAVIDFVFLDAPQIAVGDRIVAFLHRDPNPGREGTYQVVSSVRGLLRLDATTGRYERLGIEPGSGVQASVDRAVAEKFAHSRA